MRPDATLSILHVDDDEALGDLVQTYLERDAVFGRGHSTNDGTGLDLPIVQAIAEAHGWTVDLRESDAGGARFEFAGVDRPVHA